MKLLPLILLAALSLSAQNPPAAPPKKGAPNTIPPEAGDDRRGYNDTPQLPGQKWKVHDMDRPRPRKVTPGQPLLQEAPPSDAIVLFDGKDLSQWVQVPMIRPPQPAAGGTPAPPQ